MIDETAVLFLSFLAGIGIGLFYFGGLWLTLQRVPETAQPGGLIMLSYLVRTAVTLLLLFLVMGGHWPRLLAAVAGFLLARLTLIRRLGPDQKG